MPNLPPIWTTTAPAVWAQAPEWMSLHLLLEAERCPKAVVLRRSKYPQIWGRDGYPEKPAIAGICGQVVHASVARIVSELAARACRSLQDPEAVVYMKSMGGYSTIILQLASSILASLTDNPRFSPVADNVASAVKARIPRMREQVQVLLSKLVWNSVPRPAANVGDGSVRIQTRKRCALTPGTHFEVELRDEKLKWKGIADLIEFLGDRSVITDFKTGDKSDSHILQLRVYALLWARDGDVNPMATPAVKLILSYPPADHVLPGLNQAETGALEVDLKARADLVRKSFEGEKTQARPSVENCTGCHVRHICAEYWTAQRQKRTLSGNSTEYSFDDVGVVLSERRGDSTWEARCEISDLIPSSARILLRLSYATTEIGNRLTPGTRLRLIDAFVTAGDGEMPLVQMTSVTEILLLNCSIPPD
jgi:hypothetical protein